MPKNEIPPLNVQSLLRKYGLRADKKLGQNFLQDPFALEAIAFAAEIDPTDTILEIGSGLGSLTRHLAKSASRVIAVELDRDLIPPLKEVIAAYNNISIIHGDILELSPQNLGLEHGYLVVANIPYYITSAIIRHLLAKPSKGENHPTPRRIVLTVQKEVAKRICAAPGDMSILALSVQLYGKPRIAKHIPAGAFFPAPKVDSAVLSIDIYPSPQIKFEFHDTFFKLIKAGFGQKRKTLRNSLSSGLHISASDAESLLLAAKIDPMRRAETLSIDDWQNLSNLYK
ncbi:MAG: 16S rRNA (adenine(1518)-N(6)/adenine(1519)-N(6))-dimethyltransferase RsmA [Anaerolineales bacterium]|nr:16S rRNA (adenine(1518)-N(6)/adenine(1519)-N(6))-dimethyltransferase RsmA [Anaerolineales bacterium]